MSVIYEKVALIGLGLIAGSLARGLKEQGLAGRISGTARTRATIDRALELGFIDEGHDDPVQAVRDADLVVVSTPVGAMADVARAIAPALKPGATITDVGSVKGAVVDAMGPYIPDGVHFIPGHPVAGTEHSGPDSGFAGLFRNRWLLLTPNKDTDPQALERLKTMWSALGAKVDQMDVEHHDLVLAVTSHAPHLIAYTMVGVADDMKRVTEGEVINYSAAGFRDFTRIAASDPTMWRDVFLNNKTATLEILGRFMEELFALQRAIRLGDGDVLFDYFTRTRGIRRGIIQAGQDTEEPNFGRGTSQSGDAKD